MHDPAMMLNSLLLDVVSVTWTTEERPGALTSILTTSSLLQKKTQSFVFLLECKYMQDRIRNTVPQQSGIDP